MEIKFFKGPSFFEEILDYLRNPKIEALRVKIGSLIISAGMLSCWWWSKNFDLNIKKVVDAAFQDLEQKVSLTNPEFIYVILKEYVYFSFSNTIVNLLIPYLKYTSPKENVLLATLKYLVITVVNMPKMDSLLQIFLPDIKQLVLEIASIRILLFDVIDRNVFMDLLPKVCLIYVEIFLRIKLADDSVADFAFMLEDLIDALNAVISVMEESSEGSENNKFFDQILMLMKEVASHYRYLESVSWIVAPDVIVRETLRLRLRLKTLLIKGELLFLKLRDKLLDSFKEPIETLHMWIKIMIPLVIKDEKKKLKISDIEVLASKIISLYLQILDQDISESEEMLQSMKRSVSDVVDEVNVVMKEFKEIYLGETYLRIWNSNFPKTNAAGFIGSLLKKQQDLLFMERI